MGDEAAPPAQYPASGWVKSRREPELSTPPVELHPEDPDHAPMISGEITARSRDVKSRSARPEAALSVTFGDQDEPSIQIDEDYAEDTRQLLREEPVEEPAESFDEQTPLMHRLRGEVATKHPGSHAPEAGSPQAKAPVSGDDTGWQVDRGAAGSRVASTRLGDLLGPELKPVTGPDAPGEGPLHPAPFPPAMDVVSKTGRTGLISNPGAYTVVARVPGARPAPPIFRPSGLSPTNPASGTSKPLQGAAETTTPEASKPLQEAAEAPTPEASKPLQEATDAPTTEASKPLQEATEVPTPETSQPLQEAADEPTSAATPPPGDEPPATEISRALTDEEADLHPGPAAAGETPPSPEAITPAEAPQGPPRYVVSGEIGSGRVNRPKQAEAEAAGGIIIDPSLMAVDVAPGPPGEAPAETEAPDGAKAHGQAEAPDQAEARGQEDARGQEEAHEGAQAPTKAQAPGETPAPRDAPTASEPGQKHSGPGATAAPDVRAEAAPTPSTEAPPAPAGAPATTAPRTQAASPDQAEPATSPGAAATKPLADSPPHAAPTAPEARPASEPAPAKQPEPARARAQEGAPEEAPGEKGRHHAAMPRAGKEAFSDLEIAFFEEDLQKVEEVDTFDDLISDLPEPSSPWAKIFGKARKPSNAQGPKKQHPSGKKK